MRELQIVADISLLQARAKALGLGRTEAALRHTGTLAKSEVATIEKEKRNTGGLACANE